MNLIIFWLYFFPLLKIYIFSFVLSFLLNAFILQNTFPLNLNHILFKETCVLPCPLCCYGNQSMCYISKYILCLQIIILHFLKLLRWSKKSTCTYLRCPRKYFNSNRETRLLFSMSLPAFFQLRSIQALVVRLHGGMGEQDKV